MFEAEQSVVIDAGIDSVWDYVKDIRNWASLFPGCRECDVIDEHNSKWIIKVGAGGLIRTVNVLVHVEQWSGPDRVNFSYRLESEPVVGHGSYAATSLGVNQTEIALYLLIVGSGPMAPMWEVVSRPLMPQLTKAFTDKLKAAIEGQAGIVAPPPLRRALITRLWTLLLNLWRALTETTKPPR
jgi:hypothetical protein